MGITLCVFVLGGVIMNYVTNYNDIRHILLLDCLLYSHIDITRVTIFDTTSNEEVYYYPSPCVLICFRRNSARWLF
jgi:ABC-type Mn2+/Zn2+ transport system permease subunit